MDLKGDTMIINSLATVFRSVERYAKDSSLNIASDEHNFDDIHANLKIPPWEFERRKTVRWEFEGKPRKKRDL
jgi:hypothetical protein